MQTWAKRGVQAALVTGGMLAAGTGVASAAETCPDRPASSLGESLLPPAIDGFGEDTPRHQACFAGELFPDESASSDTVVYNRPLVDHRSADARTTTMLGTLDPLRDVVAALDEAPTQEMPIIGAPHWVSAQQPVRRMELAGWVADTADARAVDTQGGQSNVLFGLLPTGAQPERGGGPVGTPAEGFHRSLSWTGPIGDVVQSGAHHLQEGAFRPGAGQDVAHELVIPTSDPAVVEHFERADGIVELWQEARERSHALAAPLVEPEEELDLTSAELPGADQHLIDVPHRLVEDSLEVLPPAPAASSKEIIPLTVPGRHQEAAADVPSLPPMALLSLAPHGATPRSGDPVEAPLPALGELHALGGGSTSAPAVSRITDALAGDAAPRSEFATNPAASPVEVVTVDDLTAALPVERMVTENPFRSALAPSEVTGMALPLLDAPSDFAAAADWATVPNLMPVRTAATLPASEPRRNEDLVDTVVFSRI
ncbi:hypothetical protein HUO13_37025 [Saccharopolyspora erythraea]|uniref:hypothetical protein n=1 Tax=Saccharopolyspora erythraea TaxID=1836 RepID=UPI001BAAC2A3|nr:hypothetical protein [Saccharopolyspora erythraea]QUH05641.1 hypothetical protein HUO13_37025 [Saccharopolyspora erythraea]